MNEILSDADVKEFTDFFEKYTQYYKKKTFLDLIALARQQKQQLDEIALEEAAMKARENFGPAQDMFIPDVGWIMKNGELTEIGKEWTRMNSPIMVTRTILIEAFSKALGVSDASGWTTGTKILKEVFGE